MPPVDQDASYKVSAVEAGVSFTLVPQNATTGFGGVTSVVVATAQAGTGTMVVGHGFMLRLLG